MFGVACEWRRGEGVRGQGLPHLAARDNWPVYIVAPQPRQNTIRPPPPLLHRSPLPCTFSQLSPLSLSLTLLFLPLSLNSVLPVSSLSFIPDFSLLSFLSIVTYFPLLPCLPLYPPFFPFPSFFTHSSYFSLSFPTLSSFPPPLSLSCSFS